MELYEFLKLKKSELRKKIPEISTYLKKLKTEKTANGFAVKPLIQSSDISRRKNNSTKKNDIDKIGNKLTNSSLRKVIQEEKQKKTNTFYSAQRDFSSMKSLKNEKIQSQVKENNESLQNKLDSDMLFKENALYKEIRRKACSQKARKNNKDNSRKKSRVHQNEVKGLSKKVQGIFVLNSDDELQVDNKTEPKRDENNFSNDLEGFDNNKIFQNNEEKPEEEKDENEIKSTNELQQEEDESNVLKDSPLLKKETISTTLEELKPKSHTENNSSLENKLDEYIVQNSQYFRHISGTCNCFSDEHFSRCSFMKTSFGYPSQAMRSSYQREFCNLKHDKIDRNLDFLNLEKRNVTQNVFDKGNYKNLKTTSQSEFKSPTLSDYTEKVHENRVFQVLPSFYDKSRYQVDFDY